MNTVKIALEKPLMAHGEMVSAIEFKPPTGDMIFRNGYPFDVTVDRVRGTVRQSYNMASCRMLFSEMGLVPISTVDQFSLSDITAALGAISSFLSPSDPADSSSAASSSPGSGTAPPNTGSL